MNAIEPTDAELMTAWESDFMDSIACQDFDLTSAQEDKLAEIDARIEERRQEWRDSLDLPLLSERQKAMLTKRARRLENLREAWRAGA